MPCLIRSDPDSHLTFSNYPGPFLKSNCHLYKLWISVIIWWLLPRGLCSCPAARSWFIQDNELVNEGMHEYCRGSGVDYFCTKKRWELRKKSRRRQFVFCIIQLHFCFNPLCLEQWSQERTNKDDNAGLPPSLLTEGVQPWMQWA